ncbi:MAG TPA: glycosyltransferase family 87 protein [Acidocella sp.]|nr:glycosyltransferase family 87 protein [Acidocella sp.]HQU03832.1 glycosyltransferase family 87 protein [Acidocella sp.]
MSLKSQTKPPASRRPLLIAIILLTAIPSMGEALVLAWGICHGGAGAALRDGVDLWAGGFLATHGQMALLFDPVAYQAFLHGYFGKIPTHMWSYPPNYLLLITGFATLSAWPATLAFDACSLLALIWVLRLARQNWGLIIALLASPAALETIMTGQNAILLTAFIGGGLLLLPTRPRLGGVLVGLASIKPQLGLVLPLHLLRRSPIAVLYASLAAVSLAAASLWVFGPGPWVKFWHITSPAMTNVLLIGQPQDFAQGLISVFAAFRPLGIASAFVAQGLVSFAGIIIAARTRNPAVVLILVALASPYLHNYDLLAVALAVALLVQDRLRTEFGRGETLLFLIAWAVPGLTIWLPVVDKLVPLILVGLLASALRRGPVMRCDS